MSRALRGVHAWAYIAGFFDGEGHLRPYRPGHALVLTQTTREVLDRIREFLSSQGIRAAVYEGKRNRPEWSAVYHMYVTRSQDVMMMLEQMRPWLVVKKQIAEDTWRLGKIYPPLTQKSKTHCKHGHPLSGENLQITARQRVCRACRRESWDRWKARQTA